MDEYKSLVYARVDQKQRIIAIDGGYTISNITDFNEWIFIDSGIGDRWNLCQGNYLPKPITDDRGIYRYKYIDGDIIERSQEEMDADWRELDPIINTEELLLEMAADHEERLCMIELFGGNE